MTTTVTDYQDLVITTNTEIWNDGWTSSWDTYEYSYYSTTTESTSESTATITSTSSTSADGTATSSDSTSTSTSTSGGTTSNVYYTTSNNSYNTSNCTDNTATYCLAIRTAYSSDVAKIKFNPSNTTLVFVQARNSSTLESQVLGITSSPSNIIVIITARHLD